MKILDFKAEKFNLMPSAQTRWHYLGFDLPEGWRPQPHLDLSESLPDPWDALYQVEFKQMLQPVKLWSNANILTRQIERPINHRDVRGTKEILEQMVVRMRQFTVYEDDAAFL